MEVLSTQDNAPPFGGAGPGTIDDIPNPYSSPVHSLQQVLEADPAAQPTALAARGTKRGRKPQDPDQVIIRADCPSQHEFELQLRAFLEDASYDRNHVLFEGVFPVSAAFLVDYGPAAIGRAKSNSYKYGPAFAPGLGANKDGHVARSMSVMEALTNNPEDPKERMRKQRSIARAMENLVERVDGYRYAFHNEWLARDNDAYRFSYFCNDSLLNKDRTLGGAKRNDAGKVKRARKQVYDCQGYLTVKFSATRHCLEVLYKHIPVHMTYDERAPLPRVGTKRFQVLEMSDPDHELVRRAKEVEARKRLAATNTPATKKRKPTSEGGASGGDGAPRPRRQDLGAATETVHDGTRLFHWENHTLADETAKRNGARPSSANVEREQSEALARDATEVADLRAKLAAAEQHIQRLQANSQSSPPSWGFTPPQVPWQPPYGSSPQAQAPVEAMNTATSGSPQPQNQLSVKRSHSRGSGNQESGSSQALFQVMQLKQTAGSKKKKASSKKEDGGATVDETTSSWA